MFNTRFEYFNWLISEIYFETRKHLSSMRTTHFETYVLQFQWSQMKTGLQWSEPNVTSGVPRSDVQGVLYVTFGELPYHVTYPMMHLMLLPSEQTTVKKVIFGR